jgi:hypothetical protein
MPDDNPESAGNPALWRRLGIIVCRQANLRQTSLRPIAWVRLKVRQPSATQKNSSALKNGPQTKNEPLPATQHNAKAARMPV